MPAVRCLVYSLIFLEQKLKRSEQSGLLWRIVNEFKSVRYHRFKCSQVCASLERILDKKPTMLMTVLLSLRLAVTV